MKNDTSNAWSVLSRSLALAKKLDNNEIVVVSATMIKRTTGREPRLMTKFDTRESRPASLRNWTILPISNGDYALLPGDGYFDLPAAGVPVPWQLPPLAASIKTLPWKGSVQSESQSIDMAFASGILSDFLGDEALYLTIRGRLRSPKFDFSFLAGTTHFSFSSSGVQVEVDAGFEGKNIYLIEAKIGSRSNLHVRQLYYPFRMWNELVPDKKVSTVFLTYSDRVFSLFEFEFSPKTEYNSIRLKRRKDYLLSDSAERGLRIPSLQAAMLSTRPRRLPSSVPFPQADDIRKVIDVVDAVGNDISTTKDIALLYDFDPRQADYYRNATTFMGLTERAKIPGHFRLTRLGKKFVAGSYERRVELLISSLSALPVFREGLEYMVDNDSVPDRERIAGWIYEKTNLAGTTPLRRAATVQSWLQWIKNMATPRREGV